MSKARNILKLLYEADLDLEKLRKLTSHKDCYRYALLNFNKLGSGSSRNVYDMGNGRVLKVAKNEKGIDQNNNERDYSIDSPYVVRVIDCHPDNYWVLSEYAEGLTKKTFERIVGISFSTFTEYVKHEAHRRGLATSGSFSGDTKDFEVAGRSEFCSGIVNFMVNYDLSFGDLVRIDSYGVVKRNGKEFVVLRDYGLTQTTYATHYKKKYPPL